MSYFGLNNYVNFNTTKRPARIQVHLGVSMQFGGFYMQPNEIGIIMSFLPFSSYSAMFARVAMGNVAIWEIVISYVILLVSIVLVGILAAKVYRNSTLRYGNPLKFKTVLKSLKYKE
jgi:ABC-type Na+ efflux pump permease subunit